MALLSVTHSRVRLYTSSFIRKVRLCTSSFIYEKLDYIPAVSHNEESDFELKNTQQLF